MFIIIGYLLGDFLSGLFHWWEDRYGKLEWPILGKLIVQSNIEHHMYPTNTCKRTYWYRNGEAMIALLIPTIMFYHYEQYVLVVACITFSQANEIHAWAHMKKNPVIRFLQSIGLCLSLRHHAIHHHQPYSEHYCVITDYLNPILSRLRFWRLLEKIVLFFGVPVNKERERY